MKLSDGIKQKGKPFIIPDSCRGDLPTFFREMGYMAGAEIGVFEGGFTKKFLDIGMTMYAIDPWLPYYGTGRTFLKEEVHNTVYDNAIKNLVHFRKCTIVKKSSMEAVKDFKDGSLDFIYIDGNHIFKYVAEDLFEWEKKVKKGGIISGHDYYRTPSTARNTLCHVKPIIDAFVEIKDIKNFWLVGGSDKNDRYDKYKSWLWIKE